MARIIPICSVIAFLSFPVAASARAPQPTALGLYARARIAALSNMPQASVASYAAALTAAPDNPLVAFRAYRQAIEAGDYGLAVRSARAMAAAGAVPPDAQILLYIATLRSRDWTAARARLDELGAQAGMGFMAPMLARWVDAAARDRVAVRAVETIAGGNNAYRLENDALLALATGDLDAGVKAIESMWINDPYRAGSLRLAAASRLADLGRRSQAIRLIVADDKAAKRALGMIRNGESPRLGVVSPLDGTAFLLARIAGDLIVEGSPRSALTIARMAEFASPDNPRIRLMVAGALGALKRHDQALRIADTLVDDPVYGDDAASFRIDQLQEVGNAAQALSEAQRRATASPNDQARIGDIELRRGNFTSAATAYMRALNSAGPNRGWRLIFAAANAYDSAGDWVNAQVLLERALLLAPDEPAILNQLGYGLINNKADIARGIVLVSKAVALRPDDAAMIDSLGWAHYRRGNYADAIVLLERAVRIDRAQAEIGEHLGDAYWAVGRRIEARYAWAAARVQADGTAVVRLDDKLSGKQ